MDPLDIMSRMVLSADVTDVKYYLQHHSDTRCAIFRILKCNGRRYGESWSWQMRTWIADEEVMRCYWNGFDADVDDATQDEVIQAIQARPDDCR